MFFSAVVLSSFTFMGSTSYGFSSDGKTIFGKNVGVFNTNDNGSSSKPALCINDETTGFWKETVTQWTWSKGGTKQIALVADSTTGKPYNGNILCHQIVDTFNVKHFGAKGDGVTDYSSAGQLCLSTMGNGKFYFPPGT